MADVEDPLTSHLYLCRACGAQLEVRVGFTGKVVWTVNPANPDFSGDVPELRGNYREAKLICSADVLHTTGSKLIDGEIVSDPAYKE